MKIVIQTLVALIILAAVIAAVVIATGSYNVAADDKHWAATEAVIKLARHRSVDQRAKDLDVPEDLDNPVRIARGAEHYQAMCSGCHLAPGMKDTELRQGLYPRPPKLAEKGIHDARNAFWVVKHGLKMTGMPAWGETHDDTSLWDIVALLQTLPELSEMQWRQVSGTLNHGPAGKPPSSHSHHHGDHQH